MKPQRIIAHIEIRDRIAVAASVGPKTIRTTARRETAARFPRKLSLRFIFSSPSRWTRPAEDEKKKGKEASTVCKDAAIDFNPAAQRDQIDRTKSAFTR